MPCQFFIKNNYVFIIDTFRKIKKKIIATTTAVISRVARFFIDKTYQIGKIYQFTTNYTKRP
jgi:hypothetical protein